MTIYVYIYIYIYKDEKTQISSVFRIQIDKLASADILMTLLLVTFFFLLLTLYIQELY